ncbi:MAG: VWA domain-containing protein [Deltaproteobacteria bacterium]|jgi:hypothetical protein|nr:VWA domain-containing protein [Deltaproteobacteria bacterium]
MISNFIRTLPLIGSVLGRKYGVNVIIAGDKATSDGTNIFLPALPLDSPPDVVVLARGYLDHEAAHIRETDYELLKTVNLTPFENYLWNLIEDFRVERLMGEKYPGCRENFRALIKRFFLKGDFPPSGAQEELLNWLVLTLKSFSVPELLRSAHKIALRIEKKLPGLVKKLEAVLAELKTNCILPRDSIDYARKIVSALTSFSLDYEDAGASKDFESYGVDSYFQKVDPGEDQNGTKEETAFPWENLANDDPGDTEATICDTDSLSSDPLDIIRSLIEKLARELPETFDSMIEADLNRAHESGSQSELSVAQVSSHDFDELSQSDLASARNTTLALKTKLYCLLQAMTIQSHKPGFMGKLDTNSLHRLCVGQAKVFRKPVARIGLDTALHLLVDISGSMRETIHLASLATFSLCEALYGFPGINVAATAFPGMPIWVPSQKYLNTFTVAPILTHGDRMHKRFKMIATGNTPLGEAIWWVVQQMSQLDESRKIILVVTDGEPDSEENSHAAISEAIRLGIELYGIGLGHEAIKRLLPGNSFTLFNLSDLPRKLFKLLENSIQNKLYELNYQKVATYIEGDKSN